MPRSSAQEVPPSADESTQLLAEGPTNTISWDRMQSLMSAWFSDRVVFRGDWCSAEEVHQLKREWLELVRTKQKAEQVQSVEHFLYVCTHAAAPQDF